MSFASNRPEQVTRIGDLMSTFASDWFLCGGWAADSWLGRQTRDHHDLDIAIFQEDQAALYDHLRGWRLVGHDNSVDDDSKELWDARWLELPAHIHAHSEDGFQLEIIVNGRAGGEWVLNDAPRIARPLAECVSASPWGLPTLAPEVILYYKAYMPVWRDTPREPPRPHDELDFAALVPTLSNEQRAWLHASLSLVEPAHPWLAALG